MPPLPGLGHLRSLIALPIAGRYKRNDLINLLGATYAAVLFLGATNASAVQSVIATERTVFYRERAAGMYSELPYAFAHVRERNHLFCASHFHFPVTNIIEGIPHICN